MTDAHEWRKAPDSRDTILKGRMSFEIGERFIITGKQIACSPFLHTHHYLVLPAIQYTDGGGEIGGIFVLLHGEHIGQFAHSARINCSTAGFLDPKDDKRCYGLI